MTVGELKEFISDLAEKEKNKKMLVIIGFGLFMAPIFGVVVCGVARLIRMIGKIATTTLCLSLPFYFVTVFTLMETITQEFENIVNHSNNNVWQFSVFELVSFVCFVLLLIISSIFAKIHMKKCASIDN